MSRDSLSHRINALSLRLRIIVLGVTALVLTTAIIGWYANGTVEASTPPTSVVTVPSTSGQTVTVNWTGTIPPLTNASSDCTALADSPAVDQHVATINVPAGLYDSVSAQFVFRITWAPVVNINTSDEILTVVGVGSSDGGSPSETVAGQNLVGGNYKIVVCGFANAQPQPYTGTLTITTSAPSPPPPPNYTTGAMTFGPSIVIDFQRTEGEPLLHLDKDGNYWESGPWGFSTSHSFVHRSVDGGDQFNVVSPTALRPNPPPGGGDTTHAIDDQGVVYFGDLEGALTELDCSVSNDNGNTWKKNPACVPFTGTDRQWLAVDDGANHTIGPAGAADNTVFYAFHDVALGHLIFSSPGSTGMADLTGGLVFTPASGSTTGTGLFYSGGGNCGELVFDPVNRNLYYPCQAGNHVEILKAHVNPGQRTGLTFTTKVLPTSPGGQVSNLFPPLSVDSAGNVYVVWSDPGDHNLYYCYSNDQSVNWSCTATTPPVKVNAAPAKSNVFAWAEAGSPGNLVAVWLGNDSATLSDNMPNFGSNPLGATAFPWYGYVALITNANTPSPNFEQNRFTAKPMHYGQICNGGIGCTITSGDRVMADFLSVDIAADGAIQIAYNDVSSQYHGAHLFLARQLTGPTPIGTTLNKPTPVSPVLDPAGDAQVPHYSPTGAGPNQPQLDLRALAVNQIDANTLRIRMTVNNLSSMLPPPGKNSAFWITRFQALSRDDTNVTDVHRIFYVGAESIGGQAPIFFAGSPTRDGPPVGCTTTTPGNCKVVQYPIQLTSITTPGLAGSVSGNTFCIDLPLNAFGANRPIGNRLYNVTAFSGGRNDSLADIYAEGDSTSSFDLTLGTITPADCAAPLINYALTTLGSIPTASSTYTTRNYSADGAFDGERAGSGWEQGGGWNDATRDVWPDNLDITFGGGVKSISEIRVYTVQNDFRNPVVPDENTDASLYGIQDFEVQAWNGLAWVTVPGGTITGNTKAMRVITLNTPVTTTGIRVLVNMGRVHFSRIVEVEAYGVAGQ